MDPPRNRYAGHAVAEGMGALELSLLVASASLLATMWTALLVVAQGRKARIGGAPIVAGADTG